MKNKDLASLLMRGIAALEPNGDLTPEDIEELKEDLEAAANHCREDEIRMLLANAIDIITNMLNDQESLREPFRNEALCEEARAFLSHMDYINRREAQ